MLKLNIDVQFERAAQIWGIRPAVAGSTLAANLNRNSLDNRILLREGLNLALVESGLVL